jgi:phosphopantetheine adenylyltransferase
VRPGLILDLVPISDVAGPTGWDANIQALVVSKETLSGGAASKSHPLSVPDYSFININHCHCFPVDKIRENAKLPPLRTFIIDVISATETSIPGEDAQELKVAKMSSTAIRQWIVDNRMV